MCDGVGLVGAGLDSKDCEFMIFFVFCNVTSSATYCKGKIDAPN